MKIATWNVNSIRTRLDIVSNWLKENQVDILGLQETKVIDKDFPCQPFLDLNYHLKIFGQKAYNGVALLSLKPFLEVQKGFTPILGEIGQEWDEQKRVIMGVTDSLIVVNLYVPNGSEIASEKYEYKLNWLKILQKYLLTIQEKYGKELCVFGDFNIALAEIDIYDAKNKEKHIMFSPEERISLQAILQTVQLQDSFRKFTSEGGHFSWWDYRAGGFNRNRGWRIDHLYVTPQLYQQAVSCQVDRLPRGLPQPSDHAPVILEING